ncbi:hypothetical protein RJ641_035499 [Dillenia turbinata]|uniref:Uncharacterized protein n=1 Tax=Dillenia turbinata TaxID=194707 RepID=A0AAN8VP67_9MAGN
MEATHLLQRYRRDRRKLLEFVLSSVFIKQIQNPCGGPIDLDTLSTDYVLERVNSDGGVVDVAEATRRYFEELDYPITTESQFGNAYFFLSDPDASGSPPHRGAPSVPTNWSTHHASSSSGLFEPSVEDGHEVEDAIPTTQPVAHVEDVNISSFGLPVLRTGLSEDDLRESAYEILLASMVLYGFEIYSVEDRKKGKSSKFLSGLKSKKDTQSQPESPESHSELLNTIPLIGVHVLSRWLHKIFQISEAMDVCIRRTLTQFASRTATEPIDIPLISLGLLTGMSRADFLHEKAYMQWKKRQANLLEELLCCANSASTDFETVRTLSKIKSEKDWDSTMSPSERDDVLSTIRVIVSRMSLLPAQFGLQGETCYWTAGYGLNIRIYEKLLLGLFDSLEECQLIEAAEEIMALVKLTWSILGITQKIHDAMFGWVLFQQVNLYFCGTLAYPIIMEIVLVMIRDGVRFWAVFLRTDEALLLESATFELKKALSAEDDSEKEGPYISRLVCSCNCNGHELKLSVVQAIFFSIAAWCNCKLQDYHLHFTQASTFCLHVFLLAKYLVFLSESLQLEEGVNIGIGVLRWDPSQLQFTTNDTTIDSAAKRLGIYVRRSIEASYRRVLEVVDLKSKAEKRHPLAVLAVEMKLLAEIEFSVFYPVLSLWCPEAGIISARQIHGLYGERLVCMHAL